MMTAIKIEDVFHVEKLGTIIAGKWIEKGTLSVGEMLKSEQGIEVKITGIQMLNPYNESKIGFHTDLPYIKAITLVDEILKKHA